MVYFKIDTGSYFKFYFKCKAVGLEHTDCVSITELLFGFMYIRAPAQCAQLSQSFHQSHHSETAEPITEKNDTNSLTNGKTLLQEIILLCRTSQCEHAVPQSCSHRQTVCGFISFLHRF